MRTSLAGLTLMRFGPIIRYTNPIERLCVTLKLMFLSDHDKHDDFFNTQRHRSVTTLFSLFRITFQITNITWPCVLDDAYNSSGKIAIIRTNTQHLLGVQLNRENGNLNLEGTGKDSSIYMLQACEVQRASQPSYISFTPQASKGARSPLWHNNRIMFHERTFMFGAIKMNTLINTLLLMQ